MSDRTRRDASHLHQNAVGALPEAMGLEPLKHAARLDQENELGGRLELELLDGGGDRVGA